MSISPGLLRYKIGDACQPHSAGMRYIIHIVNDIGGYGAGFSGAVAKRWPKVETEYRRWFRSKDRFELGQNQLVQVQSDTVVFNMIAQHGIGPDENGIPPIRLEALEKCLAQIADLIKKNGEGSIHCPRIGCGLSGSTIEEIEPLLIKHFIKNGINVNIYDLVETKK